jgi:uncharacterized protein YjiS (DUF1127 family)
MNTVATTTSFAMAARTVRGGLVTLLGHLGRHIDNWVTAAIARWESQAAAAALRHLSDRELKDIGLRRSGMLRLQKPPGPEIGRLKQAGI